MMRRTDVMMLLIFDKASLENQAVFLIHHLYHWGGGGGGERRTCFILFIIISCFTHSTTTSLQFRAPRHSFILKSFTKKRKACISHLGMQCLLLSCLFCIPKSNLVLRHQFINLCKSGLFLFLLVHTKHSDEKPLFRMGRL